MNQQEVFISVAHSLKEPWISIFRDGSEATWIGQELPTGFKLTHFHGLQLSHFWNSWDSVHERIRWKNRWVAAPLRWFDLLTGFPFLNHIPSFQPSTQLKTEHPSVQVNCIDTYQFMRWKDLTVLDYFVNQTDANFLFMTTNNSYLNFMKLKTVIQNLPSRNLYGGVVAYDGASFAAGNNRIISRDVAIKMLNSRRFFSAGYIEDVAMGALARKLEIEFQELKSLVLGSLPQLEAVTDDELQANFHFRVKSGALTSRNDVKIMLRLHERLLSLGAL
jgi:hypothetical protein